MQIFIVVKEKGEKMDRYFNADDFFRTFEELDEEPYNRFPGADVILLPAKEVREIVDRYCERYCYYRKTYFGRFKDVDEATEHLERKCENCPLMDI